MTSTNECKIIISSIDSTSDSTDFFSFETIETPRFESIDTTETRFESIVLDSPESLSPKSLEKPNLNKTITESNNSTKFSCLIICCNMILILALFCASISYVVFSIIALCDLSYKQQKDICKKSNAWIYILLNLISGVIIFGITKNKKDKNKKDNLLLSYIILIAMMIWGCYELFGINCVSKLNNTLLYIMLQINIYLRIITNLIVIASICYYKRISDDDN
jgi:hypothetical protein